MMLASTLDAAVCYACLAVLLVASAQSLRRVRGLPRGLCAMLAALATLAFVIRAAAPPALLHAGFHAYPLLDSILAWPDVGVYKPGYGHASFIVLGIGARLLRVFTDGWTATALTNAALGSGMLVAAGILAFRAGGRIAAALAMAAAIAHPLFVRTAASEDAHVTACFFGMIALVAADACRRDGKFTRSRVLVLISAGLLAFYGRQSLFFWPLLLVVLATWGRVRALARRPSTWIAFAVVAVALIPKVMVLVEGSEESYGLATRLTIPLLAPSMLAHHPLFRLAESGALLVALLGVIPALMVRRDPTLIVLAGGAALAFISSVAMSAQPGYALEYGFRLPLFVLLLPLVGVGGARWAADLRRLVPNERVARVVPLAFIVVALGYPLRQLLRVLHEPSTLAQEYRLVARGARGLPLDEVVTPDVPSELKVPESAFGGRVRRISEPRHGHAARYVFQGLTCFAYPMKELVGPGADFNRRAGAMTTAELTAFASALWDDPVEAMHELGGGPPVHEMRPECEAAIRGAVRFIPWGEVEVGRQEPLDRYISRLHVPIGVWVLGDDAPTDQAR